MPLIMRSRRIYTRHKLIFKSQRTNEKEKNSTLSCENTEKKLYINKNKKKCRDCMNSP